MKLNYQKLNTSHSQVNRACAYIYLSIHKCQQTMKQFPHKQTRTT